MVTCKTMSQRCAASALSIGVCLISAAVACDSSPANVLWGPRAVPDVPDAGMDIETDAGSAGSATSLSVMLDVEPPIYACSGECSTLVARVQGGKPPYVFMWSDERLVGPGPHRICPTTPTAYSLVVSAGAVSTDAGVVTVPQIAVATTPLLCLGAVVVGVDAGTPKTGLSPGTGCASPGSVNIGLTCQKNALGIASQLSYGLSMPLMAAMPYRLSFDVSDLVRQLTTGLVADVYGANAPCAPLQLLGTLSVDATTTHQSFCATPEQAYAYIVITSRPDANALGLVLTSGVLVCPGCGAD
jgi:hypothetical protein